MKLKCLFLLLLLGISFCVHAQKRPVILEKQLEIIRKEPDNGDALKFLCQYYLNKGVPHTIQRRKGQRYLPVQIGEKLCISYESLRFLR